MNSSEGAKEPRLSRVGFLGVRAGSPLACIDE